MNRLINVGFGNMVNAEKIIAIIHPEAAPVKRMVQSAKDSGKCIDATCGRKCKAVIVSCEEKIILSALLPETIANRVNQREGIEEGE
ncbi:MAG: DUF370 domain-containing protein [Lachnospiraceae bacterium]|nr:DUF370 domain-containing protein [Lachnospiraceae bacterium]